MLSSKEKEDELAKAFLHTGGKPAKVFLHTIMDFKPTLIPLSGQVGMGEE
jgi:hypothetical protein